MKIFCIGDLHLSGNPPRKPMDVFGTHWAHHQENVEKNWSDIVDKKDVVIVCGDISWANNLTEADEDLNWLASLPGRKILLKGNHDHWWTSIGKLEERYPYFEFLQNNCVMIGKTAICGSRGWKVPSSNDFTAEDKKIYQREVLRLELSLQSAIKKDAKDIIVTMHYPPIFRRYEDNGFTKLFKKYGVSHVVYGHLHGKAVQHGFWYNLGYLLFGKLPLLHGLFATAPGEVSIFEGRRRYVHYKLCSCDTQNFTPVLVKKL